MFFILTLLDAPRSWQCLFQDPSTDSMINLIDLHHDIMFFLFLIITFVAYFLVLIIVFHSFREVNNIIPSDTTHNTLVEIIWTLLPSTILFIIAIPSFSLLYLTEEIRDAQVTLKVIGHQWFWSYEYSDVRFSDVCLKISFDSRLVLEQDLIDGDLRLLETNQIVVLPTNTNIRVLVTSDDVIHSWTVPSFGLKMDAVPGRLNQTFLNISRPGIFYGQCSEICGINHGFMPITILAVDNFFAFVNPEKINS